MIRAMSYRNAVWLLIMVAACAQERVPTTVSGSVAATLTFVEGDLLGAAEAMPESKYDYIPNDGAFKDARSFGEQLSMPHAPTSRFSMKLKARHRPRIAKREARPRLVRKPRSLPT